MIVSICRECKIGIKKTKTDYSKAQLHFCSHHCRATFYNRNRRTLFPRPCRRVRCNQLVTTLDRNKMYCSQLCANLNRHSQYTPESIKSCIQKFVSDYNRIPIKSEINYLYRMARVYYGTWNQAIVSAGFEPNPVKFSMHHIAKDGHKCDSLAERIVDDWLYNRNIKHEIHVYYPWNNRMKCDFKVDTFWIEIFGLATQDQKYDLLKKKKLRFVRQYGLRLINLTLKDVYRGNLDNKLSCLIETRGNIIPVDD